MKKEDLEKRVSDLERRVKELEAQPTETHTHFHSYPPVIQRPYQPPIGYPSLNVAGGNQ